MDFIAYRFDCWPIELEENDFDKTVDKIDAWENFRKRKEIIDGFFGDGDREYTLGSGTSPIFKIGNELTLRRYRIKKLEPEDEAEENAERQRLGLVIGDEELEMDDTKFQPSTLEDEPLMPIKESDIKHLPKSDQDSLYAGRIIFHNDGVTVLRVQKKRALKGETKDYRQIEYDENYVSSIVVLVIRDGFQYVFIEAGRRAFAPATLSYIIESTLNRLLMSKYHVMAQVKPIRRLDDFWNFLNDKQTRGSALKRLHFKFDFPNMPWPDNLLGGRFKILGTDLNAEAEVILKGQHGQPLRLNTKSGERNPDINDMARYSCDKGNVTNAIFMDGTKANFGYKQTGNVKIALSDELDKMQRHQQIDMFPDILSEEIILKAKELHNLNDDNLTDGYR